VKPAGTTTCVAGLDGVRQQLGLSYMDLWTDLFSLAGRLDVGGLTGYPQGVPDTTPWATTPSSTTSTSTSTTVVKDNPVAYRTR